MHELEPTVRAALRLGAAQLLLMDRVPRHAAVKETVDVAKEVAPRAVGLVNAVLRRVADREERPGRVDLPPGTGEAARLAVETSHPEWLVARWLRTLGKEAARAALAADNDDSPVDVLVDPHGAPPDEAFAALALEGLHLERSPWAPLAGVVAAGEAGASAALRASGALAVVDAAAQAMVELVAPADVVVDLAAAPGGKTRTLLARGRARRVIAVELNAGRAARLAGNLAAGLRGRDVLVVRADAGRPPLPRGAFGSVLLDAPCSGTGTLRKNPEARFRLQAGDLAGFAAVQRALLAAGLDLLAPGGRLTYVTCSLEPEENEEVVAALLARRPDVALVAPEPESLPSPLRACLTPERFVRVVPGSGVDGFSAAVLEKAPKTR